MKNQTIQPLEEIELGTGKRKSVSFPSNLPARPSMKVAPIIEDIESQSAKEQNELPDFTAKDLANWVESFL